MPLQRYDKDDILDACLVVFARYGYEGTSTAMLAEAADVSKALIFHHFGSKKELYLTLLDRCVDQAKAYVDVSHLTTYKDFFAARERVSRLKFEFNKQHSTIYQILREAYIATPEDLKAEIEQRHSVLLVGRRAFWEKLFERVPLRQGVDRRQAFELVMLVLDHFDQKFMTETPEEQELDETHVQRFLAERNRYLTMIRYGIEAQKQKDCHDG